MKATNKYWMIVAIYLATFMTAIESTIVVTAVRSIADSLNSGEAVSLIFSVYLFSSAIATPIFGRIADQYGKKRVFQWGLLLFLIGTVLCGLSTSSVMLILSRIIQGIGAGGIMPMTFALIGELFDLETRGKVMGLNNSAWGIASLAAPLLGGLLLSVLSWHWIFFINVPFAVVVLAIIQFFYHEETVKKAIDSNEFRQHIHFATGLFVLLAGIQLTDTSILLGAAVILLGISDLIVFYRKEQRAASAILPIKPLADGTFRLLILCVLLINGALIGFQVYVPMWVQTELAMSPTAAGLILLPSSIFFIGGSYYSGSLATQLGQKRLLQFILAVLVMSFIGLGLLPEETSYSVLLVLSSILGVSIGIGVTISVITAQSFVSKENLSTVSGFITLCRTLGQSFMITFLGMINQNFYTLSQKTIVGYHAVFFTISVIVGLLFFIVSSSDLLSRSSRKI